MPLEEAEECCGFGGTFALKNADTSVAMGADKARHVRDTGAEVLVADPYVDAGEIEVLLAQWPQAGMQVGGRRVQLLDAGVDQHAPVGMVDDVHVDRHPLALGKQVGDEHGRDGG